MEKLLPILVLLCLTSFCVKTAQSSKILTIMFIGSKSHQNVFDPMFKELANRGHEITIASGVKVSKSVKNIRVINGPLNLSQYVEELPNMFEMKANGTMMNPLSLSDKFEKICRGYFEMPEFKEVMKEKFDLVLISGFMQECAFGLIDHFKAPYIIIFPGQGMSYLLEIFGVPSLPSLIPVSMFGSFERGSFAMRAMNTILNHMFKLMRRFNYIEEMENVYRDYLGENARSVYEIENDASLLISNNDISLSFPRPLVPDIVEISGMHCSDPKPLPKDLLDFIDGAGKDGVIYFSLGSVVQAKTMPEKYRKIFVNAFSKLNQRVIWKWENEQMNDLPKNVKLGKWLPQQDILGHPNVRLFISHGGLLSTEEAVFHEKPILGLPIFGDQDMNMKNAEFQGYAKTMQLRDLTEEYLIESINTMLSESKYTKRVKELSKLFRDQPINPLEKAVFYVEYVIRHNGAKHLRNTGRDMNLIQYYSLDVYGALFVTFLIIIFLIYFLLKLILRFLLNIFFGESTESEEGRNETKITSRKKKL